MTPEQKHTIAQCKARFECNRNLNKSDDETVQWLRDERYPEAAIIAGREVAGGSDD